MFEKSRRSRLSLFGMSAAAALAVVSLGADVAQAQSSVVLQTTSVFPESDFSSDVTRYWADRVRERTEGRVDFRYFWAGSLVGNRTLDGIQDGLVDVAVQFTSYVSGDIVDLGVLDLPFSMPLDAPGLAQFHRDVRPAIERIYARYDAVVVAAAPMILPDPITCRDGFLSGPAAWEGKLVRAAGRWHSQAIQAWGGSPLVVPPTELYSALDRGTADCTLMVYNGVNSMNLYEVAPYITRADHSVALGTINIRRDVWERISEEDRKIMLEIGDEVVDWAAEETVRRLDGVLEELQEGGAMMCVPSEEEFERLVGAMDGLIERLKSEVSEDGAEIIRVVEASRQDVTQRPTTGPQDVCPVE